MAVAFRIQHKDGASRARVGVIETPHGNIQTPAFIPVATKATVKSLLPEQVKDLGSQAVLANTYHLHLEPGSDAVSKFGGLGAYMGWKGPTFTDSGGFQVFSLGAAFGKRTGKIAKTEGGDAAHESEKMEEVPRLAAVDDEGVTFQSHIDGSTHRFTPEESIRIQQNIGADIIFAFDECPPSDASREQQIFAMKRTHEWAKRSLSAHEINASQQGLFGIVQGGKFEDLRRESARIIGSMNFAGFGIGGTFDKSDIGTAVAWVNEILPEDKPRHLLGIGEPEDILAAVKEGCDTFDCVSPTRTARTGTLYTRRGKINISNARFRDDGAPIDPACDCHTCETFSRAYVAHLFRAKELLAYTLASIHNLRFIVRFTDEVRAAVSGGTLDAYAKNFLDIYVQRGT